MNTDPMKRPELKPNRAMQAAIERVKEAQHPKPVPLTSKVPIRPLDKGEK